MVAAPDVKLRLAEFMGHLHGKAREQPGLHVDEPVLETEGPPGAGLSLCDVPATGRDICIYIGANA